MVSAGESGRKTATQLKGLPQPGHSITDELFKDDALPEDFSNAAAEEVLRYRQALRIGFDLVRVRQAPLKRRLGSAR